jgi:hypothetical protein
MQRVVAVETDQLGNTLRAVVIAALQTATFLRDILRVGGPFH